MRGLNFKVGAVVFLALISSTLISACNKSNSQLSDSLSDAFRSVDVSDNDRFLSGGAGGMQSVSVSTKRPSEDLVKFLEIKKTNPKSILLDGSRMYISDWKSRDLVYYDLNSKKETVLVPAIDFVSDMVKGKNGEIVAGLFTGEQVVSIAPNGKTTKLGGNLGKVSAVVVAPNGDVYAASYDRGIVYKLPKDPNADPEKIIDNLKGPAGLVFGPDGRLYISQYLSSNESIVRYDLRVLTREVVAIGVNQASKILFMGSRMYVGAAEAGHGVIWEYQKDGSGQIMVAGNFKDPIVGPVTDGKYLFVGSSAGQEKAIYRIAL